jgi:hypothetical protein
VDPGWAGDNGGAGSIGGAGTGRVVRAVWHGCGGAYGGGSGAGSGFIGDGGVAAAAAPGRLSGVYRRYEWRHGARERRRRFQRDHAQSESSKQIRSCGANGDVGGGECEWASLSAKDCNSVQTGNVCRPEQMVSSIVVASISNESSRRS